MPVGRIPQNALHIRLERKGNTISLTLRWVDIIISLGLLLTGAIDFDKEQNNIGGHFFVPIATERLTSGSDFHDDDTVTYAFFLNK